MVNNSKQLTTDMSSVYCTEQCSQAVECKSKIFVAGWNALSINGLYAQAHIFQPLQTTILFVEILLVELHDSPMRGRGVAQKTNFHIKSFLIRAFGETLFYHYQYIVKPQPKGQSEVNKSRWLGLHVVHDTLTRSRFWVDCDWKGIYVWVDMLHKVQDTKD